MKHFQKLIVLLTLWPVHLNAWYSVTWMSQSGQLSITVASSTLHPFFYPTLTGPLLKIQGWSGKHSLLHLSHSSLSSSPCTSFLPITISLHSWLSQAHAPGLGVACKVESFELSLHLLDSIHALASGHYSADSPTSWPILIIPQLSLAYHVTLTHHDNSEPMKLKGTWCQGAGGYLGSPSSYPYLCRNGFKECCISSCASDVGHEKFGIGKSFQNTQWQKWMNLGHLR